MTHLIRAENEWRYDLLDETFTVVARNRRTLEPLVVELPSSQAQLQAAFTCPFCEDTTLLHTLDRVSGASGHEVLALTSPTPLGFVEDPPPLTRPFESAGALAAHELFVPTGEALHGKGLADLDEETLALLLWIYCRRRADLGGDRRLGGASLCIAPAELSRLTHVHAALLAVPFLAPRFSSGELCPACRELQDARARGRVVIEDDAVVAYVPFAPRSNVHVRFASLVHGTSLLSARQAEEHSADVARALHDVIARIARIAAGARLSLRVCPLPLAEADDGKSGHLLLEVEALFDVDDALSRGLGVRIISVPPEELAERLRSA